MRRATWLRTALSLGLLGLALVFLGRELSHVSARELLARFRELSPARVTIALLLGALNYVQLSGYDWCALRYLRRDLPLTRVLLASFVATAFGHNIGPSIASAGSVRYRYYSSWGLGRAEIATMIGFLSLTFVIGYAAVAGPAFTFMSARFGQHFPLPMIALRSIGVGLLILLAAYITVCVLRPAWRIRGRSWSPPRVGVALGQIATAACDWLLMAAMLQLWLPPGAVNYGQLLLALLISQVAGVFSQVPGGLGVFESVMLAALAGTVPPPTLFGALLLYRVSYFFLPLGFAAILLIARELRREPSPAE